MSPRVIEPSPLLRRTAAVAGSGLAAGVADHYGDPVREQRALLAGDAVVDLGHRGVVTVSGPDRLRWLHSMTTQHLLDLAPGESAETLVLSPHGHVEHVLHLVDDGETTWCTVAPGTAPALAAWLTSMQFMLRVEVRDETEQWAVVGEALGAAGAAEGTPTWVDRWPGVVGDSVAYGPAAEEHPGRGWRWRERLVPRERLADAVGERPLAGLLALEALRVAAARPDAADVDHRTLPHELDWLRTAVHLHKGCYRGQETVARVVNLGRPPRRLALAHLDGSGHTLPEPGAELGADGRPVGHLTSVARHHEDGPIGLALLRRSVPGDAVLVTQSEGSPVTVATTELVSAQGRPAGTTSPPVRPRLPRPQRSPGLP